ncbi:MAG TPA: D-alanyl-D-alanine carboxypeptidase family protein [Burkholderiales bacterium]|nr:D-alanyl-D-alanine carboxypeptidase family protein [Burkholderiales bacterium]
MARLFSFLVLLVAPVAFGQAIVPPPSIAAKSWLLFDLQSQQMIAQRSAEERVEPASLTKLMSAYLIFDALKQKRIALSEELFVSDKAWRAAGARMFLKPGSRVSVDQLMRAMIIISANDATVALAEGVFGTEETFVQRMNAQAQRLGLTNTHFANATGLPHAQHYSTAMDLARLAAALIRDHPQYLPLYQFREFTYNAVTQQNRNLLLGRDPRIDGLKTGYTESAGYCIIVTARRDERRLLAVVMGAPSESTRAIEAQKLINYGFQHYETIRVYAKGAVVSQLPVWKGSEKQVKAGFDRDLYISVPRGQANRVQAELSSQQPLIAPVNQQQRVGVLRLSFDGKPLGEYPVVALETVGVANLVMRAWDSVRLLFN